MFFSYILNVLYNHYLFNINLETSYFIKTICFQFFIWKLLACLLSIFSAFLPNSNTKPNVNIKKNTNIIIKPYIPLEYALTIYGYTNNISKSNSKNNNANIKKEMLELCMFWPKKEWNPHSNALFFFLIRVMVIILY